MRRRWFGLRVRLHDWMWERETPARMAARRLPLYFADPYYMPPWKVAFIADFTPEVNWDSNYYWQPGPTTSASTSTTSGTITWKPPA